MTLITSISGIRGIIGGKSGQGLTPIDICKYTAAYLYLLQQSTSEKTIRIVLGRDARISGPMVHQLVSNTLVAMGADVIDIGMASTPTVEMAVIIEKADGGIIITASHNPREWNALKLLNKHGEFLNAEQGNAILSIAADNPVEYANVDGIGKIQFIENYEKIHIEKILQLPLVTPDIIQKAGYKVVIDCVNSVGGIAIPPLLRALGVSDIVELYCTPNGDFPHNPEPLPEHLTAISDKIKQVGADVGFVVDPDVDRLAIVCEDGSMFGEEYTLVSVADYVLQHKAGNTVSNLSSTRALKDITELYKQQYNASAVGEVNVVEMMKKTNAVVGGEGNGGVIYPDLHYGRDALVGIALFLSNLARRGCTVSKLRAGYPYYVISKNKMKLPEHVDIDNLLHMIGQQYHDYHVNTTDGIRIDFDKDWVHLRKSNTEPIIRIYAESTHAEKADRLAQTIIDNIRSLI